MAADLVPRYHKVCYWCRFLDHSGPECRRNAPVPVWESNEDAPFPKAEWPFVRPHTDWCGQFEEGSAADTIRRKPQPSDLDCANVDPAVAADTAVESKLASTDDPIGT